MSERAYRWLLRLYPRGFRATWGDELKRDYGCRRAEARHAGHLGGIRLWWLLLRDLARSVPAEHAQVWRQRLRARRTGSRRRMSDVWLRDVRYGVRTFVRAPGFTAACLVTLALGVGATTTIFSIVDGVLLRPLPYRGADRLVQVGMQVGPIQVGAISAPDFRDVRARTQSFEALAATRSLWLDLAGTGEPERFDAAGVTASYFDVLGVRPALGRAFVEQEDRPGGALVVILSDGLWRRRFGADPAVVGRTLTLNGEPRTIVGIMPRGFYAPEAIYQHGVQVWAPLGQIGEDLEERGAAFLQVIGRMRPGATVATARADLSSAGASIVRDYPGDERSFWLASLHERTVGEVGGRLYVLMGAVAFLLMIACANVANLFLVRATERGREMAMRAALGASRARIAGQLLMESAGMSLAGALLGVLLAWGGLRLFKSLSPGDVPRLAEVRLDVRVLAFALGLAVFTGLLFGLAPALQGARRGLTGVLREGGHGSTAGRPRRHVRSVLVVLQTAIALVLLTGAGLLINSFVRLSRVPPGFDVRNVVWLQVLLPPDYDSPERRNAFFEPLVTRIRSFTGVAAAGAIHGLPLDRNRSIMSVLPEGHDVDPEQAPRVAWHSVSPGYFGAMGIPLRSGRDFTLADRDGSPPVAVVSEVFAARYWPGESAIGRNIRIGGRTTLSVVGVAADVRHYGLSAEVEPMLYRTLSQVPRGNVTLVARHGAVDPGAVIRQMREAVWAQDGGIPLPNAGTLQQHVSASLVEPRFYTALLACFAAVALALALIGLYGTLAYTVRMRRREVGIRVALGAARGDVRRMVVGQGMRLTAAGILLGIAGAWLASRTLTSFVFGVAPTDVPTFGAVAVAMAVFALLACWIPARRAAATDPVTSLRTD